MQASNAERSPATEQYTKNEGAQRRPKGWLAAWMLEIAAVCFSIICLAAIVALVMTIDGKPYNKWRIANVNITPNALLAILSAFLKSSLLLLLAEGTGQLKWIYFQQRPHRLIDLQTFDEASRGPLGAAKLIASIKFRAIIAVTGALVIILTIAVDPFTQQILSFPTSTTNVTNAIADIASSRVFTGFQNTLLMNYEWSNQLGAAIVAGITGNVQPTNYSCSSSDCIYPKFITLGFCSKCVDISDQVILLHGNKSLAGPFRYAQDVTYILPQQDNDVMAGTGNLTMKVQFVKEGNWITTSTNLELRWTALRYNGNGSSTHGTSIASVDTLRLSRLYALNTTLASIRPQALSCSFTMCEQSHDETIYAAGLHDPVTSSRDLFVLGLEQLKDAGAMLPAWPAGQPKPPQEALDISQIAETNDTYWINSGYLEYPFVPMLITYLTDPSYYEMSYMAREGNRQTPKQFGEAGNYDYVSLMMDDIALSITNKMRTLSTTTMVRGTAREPATFVRANWYWLIFPAVLVVLSILFLVMTIIFSTETDSVLWKTSILPFLYHNLQTKQQRPTGGTVRDMERAARKCIVVLQNDNGKELAFRSNASNSNAGDGDSG